MRNFLITIISIASTWYGYHSYQSRTVVRIGAPQVVKQGVYDEYGIPIVQVFTINGCTMCVDIIKKLERRNVPFETIHLNPNNQDDNFQRWKKVAKNTLPFVLIGNKAYITKSNTRIVTILGENFGEKYLTDNEKRYFPKHFYVDGYPKIVMYGTSSCPNCAKLKRQLEDGNIDYLEVDVKKSGEEKLMSDTMEIETYPTIWIGYNKSYGITLDVIERYL